MRFNRRKSGVTVVSLFLLFAMAVSLFALPAATAQVTLIMNLPGPEGVPHEVLIHSVVDIDLNEGPGPSENVSLFVKYPSRADFTYIDTYLTRPNGDLDVYDFDFNETGDFELKWALPPDFTIESNVEIARVVLVLYVATYAFIGATPNPVGVGQMVNVSMLIEPPPPTPTDRFSGLEVYFTRPDGTTEYIGPLFSDPNGSVSVYYTPDLIGTYALQLNYPGESFAGGTIVYESATSAITILNVTAEPQPTPTPSPTPEPTPAPTPTPTPTPSPTPTPTPITLPPATMEVSVESSAAYSGFSAKISGTLTAEGVGLPSAGVQLYISVSGGRSWDALSFVNTDSNGRFSVVWRPSVTGNYLLNATWGGNSEYSATSTIVNFALTPYEEESVFSVTSNSTLSGLLFDSTNTELRFSVTGPSGTTGYVDVVIPKTLISDISSLKVYVDGSQISFNSISQTDSWVISFTYPHSSHEISINMSSGSSASSGENLLWSILPYVIPVAIIAIIIVIAALLVSRRKKTKKA